MTHLVGEWKIWKIMQQRWSRLVPVLLVLFMRAQLIFHVEQEGVAGGMTAVTIMTGQVR